MDPRALREATRAEHEATEARMPLMGPDLTLSQYVATLRALLPIVQSWETWSWEMAPAGMRGMLAARRRAGLLLADLQRLDGEGSPATGPGVDWGAVVDPRREMDREDARFEAAFLGAMYVMEGSTLGGRFLARHVEAVLGLAPGQGDAYFAGHGEATGSLWREVTQKIAAVPEVLSPVLVQAARAAFYAFGNALPKEKVAPVVVQN